MTDSIINIETNKQRTIRSIESIFDSKEAMELEFGVPLLLNLHDTLPLVESFYQKNIDPSLRPYFCFNTADEGGIYYEFDKFPAGYNKHDFFFMIEIGMNNNKNYFYSFFSFGAEQFQQNPLDIKLETSDLNLFLESFFDEIQKLNSTFSFIEE